MADAYVPHPAEEQLHAYLDDALTAAEKAAVESHVGGCPMCATRLESLEALSRVLAWLPDAALTRDLRRPVMARIRPRRVAFRLRWVLAAEGVIAGALVLAAWDGLQSVLSCFLTVSLETRFLVALARLTAAMKPIVQSAAAAMLDTARLLVPALPLPAANLVLWPDAVVVLAVGALLWAAANHLLLAPRRTRTSG
ncbi:MAG: zf-HC2 domain-containing protein [Chloroflexota bacterium]